jgi:pimeloyl-ACP methyl ester carboxylesterase
METFDIPKTGTGYHCNLLTDNSRRKFLGTMAVAGATSLLPWVSAIAAEDTSTTVSKFKSRIVETNGIKMHIVEQGNGPLVLLVHGFPECWYSWRHQISVLADAGYRVVAPDMRGYGKTDIPKDIGAYTILELVGDLTGLLDALGEKTCSIVGHDFGAVVSWNACLLHPNRFKAIAALSVPYSPRHATPPLPALRRLIGNRFFYIDYFQTPGIADAELNEDVAKTLRAVFFTGSAESDLMRGNIRPVWKGGKYLDILIDMGKPPTWMTDEDFNYYVMEFKRNGFTGGLNWYRNLDRNWELMAAYQDAKITVPALFITGAEDPIQRQTKPNFDALPDMVPHLTKRLVLQRCGHWTQQEKPGEVNAELLQFLKSVAA